MEPGSGATPGNQQPSAAVEDGQRVPVKTAVVEIATMPIKRHTIGWVEPIATVAVRSRIDSAIVEQHAKEGAFVSAGDVLFILDDREAKATIAQEEATLARDQALLDRALGDLERAQALMAKQSVSRQSLDQSKADARAAQASVTADRAAIEMAKLTLSYTVITAPIGGRLGAIPVSPGNLVRANDATALVTITQMQPIRVAFTLPDRDLDDLRAAMQRNPPATVRVFTKGTTAARAEGRLSFIDSALDANSGTITAKAEFANANLELWPGQYFDVEIEIGRLDNAATIPTVALQVGQNGLFVFVVTPEDIVELRQVTVAGADGDRSAITNGLAAGERVVIEGQHLLAPGMAVTPIAEP